VAANEYDAYASGAEANVFTMLHITAPTLPPEMLETARKPIHVSAVLDVSGSMSGTKLELLKDTLRFVIKEMQTTDSLSIVTYNATPTVLLPDTPMHEMGKLTALSLMDGIVASGGTNISDGLFKGLEQFNFGTHTISPKPSAISRRISQVSSKMPSSVVLDEAQQRVRRVASIVGSPVDASYHPGADAPGKHLDDHTRSVWLLTDGNATNGIKQPHEFALAMKRVMGERKDVTVYTFGFGTPHNEELLSSISEAGGGQYYFIKDLESIKKNFADCLGGLMSVVVKTVEINASVPAGMRLVRVLGDDTAVITGNKMRTVIRDMCSEEQRDVIIEVQLPALTAADLAPRSIVQWSMSYISTLDSTTWSIARTSKVSRPSSITDATADVRVMEQRTRVEVLDAMEKASKLCNNRDYEEARRILNHAHVHSSTSNTPQSQMLAKKCAQAMSCMNASSWEKEGKYKTRNACHEQRYQRTCDDDDEAMYTNATKAAMKKKCSSK
jgi:hypothetical protein